MQYFKLNELTEQTLGKLYEHVSDAESLSKWKSDMFNLINAIAEFKLSSLLQTRQENSSLDPVDWVSARCVAYQMLDLSFSYIQHVRDRPVCRSIPDNILAALESESLPEQGQSLSNMCHDVFKYIVPYTLGNTHPRFYGWTTGEGTLGGALADMTAAMININCAGRSHSGAIVERIVIDWMRQLFGFPKVKNGGLLVSGTSMATIVSMATARQRTLINIRQDGLVNGPQLVAYASTEVHGCVAKALELIGIGSKALHLVPVDDNFQIKIAELKTAIRDDREKGLVPFCIVGNAGTMNTAAFDNLLELSLIARAENIWFHVDGAFGGLIILDPQRRHLVTGIDQADSLAFDFHKWLHCPLDAGCVLIRDGALLESTFSLHASHIDRTQRDVTSDDIWFCHLGPELSRSFRALKVWFTLKEHGTVKLGRKIADNCEQAKYLVSLLEKHEHIIRILRPISLNIVNFRLEPKELDKTDHELIDMFNSELVADIEETGIAFLSTLRIQNHVYIHVCIVSHRTILDDITIFIDTLLKLYQTRLQAYITQKK